MGRYCLVARNGLGSTAKTDEGKQGLSFQNQALPSLFFDEGTLRGVIHSLYHSSVLKIGRKKLFVASACFRFKKPK